MEGIRILRSDRSPVLRGSYPNIAGAPIPGFEFGGTGQEEWLIVVRYLYTGDYDPRYYMIDYSEDNISDRLEHPDYPGVGQWVIREQLVKLSVEEILNNVENAENFANKQIIKETKEMKMLYIALRAVARKLLNASNISNAEQKAIDYVNNAGKKLLDNRQNRKAIIAVIDNEPDMDSGWVNIEEPEDLT